MMAFTQTNMELPRSSHRTYLHGLHHSCCLSRPYLARHFFGFVISAKKKIENKIFHYIFNSYVICVYLIIGTFPHQDSLIWLFHGCHNKNWIATKKKAHCAKTWCPKLQSKHFVFEVAWPLAFILGNSLDKSKLVLVWSRWKR